MSTEGRFAALFIDFENIYYFLRNRLVEEQGANDAVIRMIRMLRNRLQQTYGEICIIQHAYADFERFEENSQSDLYLIGIESHHVLGTEHKNAADMRLCIDAMETLYTRAEISSFVFMAGDRDYIPVIQHLRKHARTIRVAAFAENISGDLLLNVGEENFINGRDLLPSEFKLGPERKKPVVQPMVPVAPANPAPIRPPLAPRFVPARHLGDREREALTVMLKYFGNHPEVWVTPFLRKLREEMPLLEEYERKALLSDLEDKGAGKVEKRQGNPADYSVFVLNWDHPDVRELNP
jgi:uncharacterized LabA/DUF88 family protein